MKIKNELVSIKIGNKHYDFNNLILDEYLSKFVKAQLDKEKLNSISYNKRLYYCLLKFDTPFENLKGNVKLNNDDFDICLVGGATCNQIISENKIMVEYTYDTGFVVWDYEKDTATNNYISNYYGKKITAIGFNSYWVNDSDFSWKVPVCAVLDTSNYNIYLQQNQELSITRRDIITTDALFYTNDKNKIPGPVHLAPCGVPQIIYQPNIYNNEGNSWHFFNDPGYGILYSVGLSSYADYIDKEFIIGQDVQAVQNGTELIINGIENYLSTDSPLFCSENIYSNTSLYPVKTNYKYIIFKYKVWQLVHSGTYDNVVETPTDTGYYYYQAIPISKFGKSNLKIKYERG